MASTVEVENQGPWPFWIPPTLSSNMPAGLQGVLSSQEYQAIKSYFDQTLASTAVSKVTLAALVGVPLIAISVTWGITLVQSSQGENQSMMGLIFTAVFSLFIGISTFSTFTRSMRSMKQRRNNAYHIFVAQTNQNFPQTHWAIQEFGARISFTVVPTGATLPAVVSDAVVGATVPVVAAVVVGSAETNEGNPIQAAPMVV
ncbi:unnamed protein product [Cladocopium goreaui]|uniref:Uncharacterized protein n=1 Tax=Cladocopium goreaui TaxID=2562237 RepID=A0A9P1DI87_9DINO|nr:unnamed protein product [Cladocopium goreaui]